MLVRLPEPVRRRQREVAASCFALAQRGLGPFERARMRDKRPKKQSEADHGAQRAEHNEQRLASPVGENRVFGHGDRYDERKISQRMDRNDARNSINITRRKVRAAALLYPRVKPRLIRQLAARHAFIVRIARQHHAVATERGDRSAIAQTDGAEEIFKVTNIDCT